MDVIKYIMSLASLLKQEGVRIIQTTKDSEHVFLTFKYEHNNKKTYFCSLLKRQEYADTSVEALAKIIRKHLGV